VSIILIIVGFLLYDCKLDIQKVFIDVILHYYGSFYSCIVFRIFHHVLTLFFFLFLVCKSDVFKCAFSVF